MTVVAMFFVGAVVGLFYVGIRVRSPAPPLIGLTGLAGMLIGQEVIGWLWS